MSNRHVARRVKEVTLSPEREKEIRDYVGHAFNRRATNVCLTELLAEIDRIRLKWQSEVDELEAEIDRLNDEISKLRLSQKIDGTALASFNSQLAIAREALARIAHPSDWLDHGSSGIVRIAEEALAKLEGK